MRAKREAEKETAKAVSSAKTIGGIGDDQSPKRPGLSSMECRLTPSFEAKTLSNRHAGSTRRAFLEIINFDGTLFSVPARCDACPTKELVYAQPRSTAAVHPLRTLRR